MEGIFNEVLEVGGGDETLPRQLEAHEWCMQLEPLYMMHDAAWVCLNAIGALSSWREWVSVRFDVGGLEGRRPLGQRELNTALAILPSSVERLDAGELPMMKVG